MQKILIYQAMQAEADPLIEQLKLKPSAVLPKALPMRTYSGQFNSSYHSAELCLITSGTSARHGVDNIGTEAAAVGLQAALQLFPADLVINAGTAGGFQSKGARIGDVYLGKAPVCFHDHRIPITGFDDYGIGGYPCYEAQDIADQLKLKMGRISTSNALDYHDADAALMEKNETECKDMEAAALAWVCDLYKKPFIPIKAITDLVDTPEETADVFLRNLSFASEALQSATIQLIAAVLDAEK